MLLVVNTVLYVFFVCMIGRWEGVFIYSLGFIKKNSVYQVHKYARILLFT